jgi:hypothetical protein
MNGSDIETCASSQELATRENFRGRFMLLVNGSDDGCWVWQGPMHSSGRGRYLWRQADGGNGRYVLANRVSYYLATGEWPRYLRNLCGTVSCVKASHWRIKSSEQWKPKRKAIRGRVRQLSDSEIQQIRLLDSFGSDEDELGQQYGLTKRQVAQIALGKVRPDAGGRIRSSRFKGIHSYHEEWERELLSLSMRPDAPPPVDLRPQVASPGRPFPHTSYGHPPRRRLRW